MAVAEITNKHRTQNGLTLQEFADSISAVGGTHLTRQAVYIWENGPTKPNRWLLRWVFDKTEPDDWRHNWAMDILAEL